jgi:hypothetical protein
MNLVRLADWITVITGPLSVAATISAWSGLLDRIDDQPGPQSATIEILAALMVALVWCFFFFAQLRLFARFHRTLSEVGTFYLSMLVGFLGLVMSTGVELLILQTMIPEDMAWPIVQVAWISVPVVSWVGATYIAIGVVSSSAYDKDAA